MTTMTLRGRLAAAEAELREIAAEARDAYRHYRELEQKQTAKADEIRELHRQIREEDDR